MTYEEHHAALLMYLKAKVDALDWHGVSDAANDLRVLEAQPPHVRAQPRYSARVLGLDGRVEQRHPTTCPRFSNYRHECLCGADPI